MGAPLPLSFQWRWLLPVRTHLVAIRELLECARQIAAPFFVLALELGLALNRLVNLRLVLSLLPALKEEAELGAIVLRVMWNKDRRTSESCALTES